MTAAPMILTSPHREPGRRSADGGAPDFDESSLASIRAAFDLFERQSRKLEAAYHSLEQDLARSNQTLQERNHELTETIQEVKQVSSRLESVIESLTDGFLVIGVDGRIERCNSSAVRMLERERDCIVGERFDSLVRADRSVAALQRVIRGGSPVLDCPWTLHDSVGGRRPFRVSLAPVHAPDGSVVGAICNLRDVTEIRRLEKRLHSHERLAALGEMAASVAHEIRNPLGTIEGFARLLRRDLSEMPGPLRLAERIVEGAQNLNYVITNLLTYARPTQLQVSYVPVAHIFGYGRETLRDKAARAEVVLSMADPPPDLAIRGDARQLAQALLNLGINAIESCEPGDTVRIEASSARHSIVLTIADTGCGMGPAQAVKVFDPFFTTKEGGTGLGLSLTRKIVDAHGGDITVTSNPGDGSVFSLELPRAGGES